MSEGEESTRLKLKVKDLIRTFPKFFEHIKLNDIYFFRIDRRNDGVAIILQSVDTEPWKYIFPYKYIITIFDEFDCIETNDQMHLLFSKLCGIPKDYEKNNYIVPPDVVAYKQESELLQWLEDKRFNLV